MQHLCNTIIISSCCQQLCVNQVLYLHSCLAWRLDLSMTVWRYPVESCFRQTLSMYHLGGAAALQATNSPVACRDNARWPNWPYATDKLHACCVSGRLSRQCMHVPGMVTGAHVCLACRLELLGLAGSPRALHHCRDSGGLHVKALLQGLRLAHVKALLQGLGLIACNKYCCGMLCACAPCPTSFHLQLSSAGAIDNLWQTNHTS